MSQSNNILQELKELQSSLAEQFVKNVYTVPAGYFDGLADEVLNKIKNPEEGSVLDSISKEMPYSVPQGYFDGLEETLMQGVRESNDYVSAKEELEALSPLLSDINKQTPYSVPQGYFDSVEIKKPAAKVVSITSRKWFRYAAAAVIAGAMLVVSLLLFKQEKEPGAKQLAKVSRDIRKMTTTQQDNLIENISLTGTETAQLSPEKQNEIKQLLQTVSEEELKDFTEQTEDIEDVLMTE